MSKKSKTTTKKATKKATKPALNFATGVFIKETEYSILMDFNAKAFCQWMKDNINEKGYVRTIIRANKEGSRFSHNMSLNDYSPKAVAEKAVQEATEDLPF
tara:strand:- start:1398 stop:1700 length:303 start_codon:yes stop_codon:yes gene_type:complete